jgi:hypothetical protein
MTEILLSFPTLVWTMAMTLVVVYWLLVILGTLDLDALEYEAGFGDGGALGQLLPALGLGGVPVSVALSLLVVWAWLFSALGGLLLAGWGLDGAALMLARLLLLVLSLGLALFCSALMTRPLQTLFAAQEGRRRSSLIGGICTVTTLRVDESFGQAEYSDGGAGLLIQVRAGPGNGLGRGDLALIVHRDEEAQAFRVRPYDSVAAEERDSD